MIKVAVVCFIKYPDCMSIGAHVGKVVYVVSCVQSWCVLVYVFNHVDFASSPVCVKYLEVMFSVLSLLKYVGTLQCVCLCFCKPEQCAI